jgi:hypothetical protein
MKKTLVISIFALFLSGCSPELSISEIKLINATKDARNFYERVEDKNGAHLFFEGEQAAFVFLNGKNVVQGERAIHFSDFSVDTDGETLKIYYSEEKTVDYSNDTMKHQVILKINKDKNYEGIWQIFYKS